MSWSEFWQYFIAWACGLLFVAASITAIAIGVTTHEASLRRECFERDLVYWPTTDMCAKPPTMPSR